MKKLFAFLVLLAIVLAGIYVGSPYYRAYQLKQAYDSHDGQAIASAIDYPKLTTSIKNQLSTRFDNTLQQYPMVAGLGGSALTKASEQFINQSVDGAITADNIATAIGTQGQVNLATKQLAGAWAIASNKVNLSNLVQDIIAQKGDVETVVKNQVAQITAKQSQELANQVQTGNDSDKPELKYCAGDLSCFQLSGEVKGYPLTVTMQRQGLIDWKIVDVELP